ncbi:MAG: nucleotidyltransferase family protein [Burkholderiales bacterium]|nr:nucleotidyltransferase family protein [Burkholderiales bacterium]MBH2017757.1 nucleotidyltransferase family protein [Burkholderiales bacterium]
MSPARPPANLPALILAAGRGERMRPLTDTCPKPLLAVRGKPLIVWHLEALARDGVRDVVINTAHLEEQFEPALGDGSRWGLRIRYSHERADHGGALETAGGIAQALPLLAQAPGGERAFWVLAGDVFVPGFHFDADVARAFADGLDERTARDLAHLWLVPNPAHVPQGDFALDAAGRVHHKARAPAGAPTFTYSTIGLYRPGMVDGVTPGQKAALRPCFDRAIDTGRLSGRTHLGEWTDVGTPERLAQLDVAS